MNQSANAVLGLVLWSQSLFLASTFRSWSAVLAICAMATLTAISLGRWEPRERTSRRTVPRWLRWFLLACLFACITVLVAIWRIGSQVDRDINPVQVGVDVLAHAMMICSLILWILHPRDGHVAMLPLGLLVVLLSVAAGGTSTSLAAQTTVALASCLGFTIGSQLILGASRTDELMASLRDRSADRSKWLAPAFSLLTLSILMMGTSAVANATNFILPTIQNRLQEQLKASMDSMAEQTVVGGTRYVAGGRLGSIRRHMLGSPREIALQIYCQVPPGYMRGNVFDLYRGGRWLDSGSVEFSRMISASDVGDAHLLPSGPGMARLQRSMNPPLQRFSLINANSPTTIDLEVHNDPFKGPMVFLPLATHALEARSREIVVSKHATVRVGVDVTRPYVACVGTILPRSELSATLREITTDLSPDIDAPVRRLAQSVCATATTTKAKASAISEYFQQEYGYSLVEVQIPQGADPLLHFLESKHDAHCEYFASATALMLRSVGVPSRYVIGYIADEPSEEVAGRWLARNQDAHAWVEAYDDQSGRWFPVESTPGRKYQTVEPEQRDNTVAGILSEFLSGDSDENDTLVGRIVGWIGSMRASDPLLWLFRIAQLPLFLVLAFLLWNRYLKPAVRGGEDPADIQSRKLLRQADRRMHRFALHRRPSETLYQFADRIDQASALQPPSLREGTSGQLACIAEWYRAYADARYQGQIPLPLTDR